MFGECHAHVIMDGINYREAVDLHRERVVEEVIRRCFREYQKRGITFVRDGGDFLDVSKKAREIAPEFGIDYRSPIFAIHKKGHYGSIVGKAFLDLREYKQLVLSAKAQGADFIKIMTSGILDFRDEGKITGEPLEQEEVREMIHIAHDEGMAVMVHTNGDEGVQRAILGGADSIEHGNYMHEETICMLAESDCVWVPTLVPIRNLEHCGRFSDDVIQNIMRKGETSLRCAYELGAFLAVGSDAGAYRVPHGRGTEQEAEAILSILGDTPEVRMRLEKGESLIKERFHRIK